jgi:ferredoxin
MTDTRSGNSKNLMSTQYKVCNCNRSMPLDAAAGEKIGAALGVGPLPVATQLCRKEVGGFLSALDGVDDVVVACTQERALFGELATQRNAVAPLRFVNIRETGGWGREARDALPKMTALLAAAALPTPEPVPTVSYDSAGHVLIVGPARRVLPWAQRLQATLEVSVLLTESTAVIPTELAPGRETAPMLSDRAYPTWSGTDIEVKGWLGAFEVEWRQSNPIDLEICTRCNACVDVCPENAIDLSYQIDMAKCTGHRDCVKACGAIGAIDFTRDLAPRSLQADMVFDLSDAPILTLHQPPQGYFAPGGDALKQADDAMRLTQMVGQFEKAKFFVYKDKLCAHGRNGITGCTACIDVCSAEAVSHNGNLIKVNPQLCVGCGACTTVCPSGALSYAWPRATDLGSRIKTVLDTFIAAGGREPGLLLHAEEEGTRLIEALGRMARANTHPPRNARVSQSLSPLSGMPARLVPLPLHHVASVGIDLWLAAVAWGATHIGILLTGVEAPQYVQALEKQIDVAHAILAGLGYAGTHIALVRASSPEQLDLALQALRPAATPMPRATFHIAPEKRTTLDFAIEHLLRHAPPVGLTAAPAGNLLRSAPEIGPQGGLQSGLQGSLQGAQPGAGASPLREIALPAGALYGTVEVNKTSCTLCMACVGACPESALMDNANLPQLRFVERNCVQCGLCEKTCPEDAIILRPRLLLGDAAKQARVLNESPPYNCVRCNKPFGTRQIVENMLSKLALHGAFAGNLDRIRMCSDCRVIDMMDNTNETSITDIRRRP